MKSLNLNIGIAFLILLVIVSNAVYIVNDKQMSSLRDVYENLKATGIDIGMLFASIAEGLDTKTYEIA